MAQVTSPPTPWTVDGTVTVNQGTANAGAKWSVQVDNSSAIAVSEATLDGCISGSKLAVKAADGDVFVRQATAANLNATVVGTGTFAVQNTPAASTYQGVSAVTGSASAKTAPIFVALADGTNTSVLGAMGTAVATSVYVVPVMAGLQAAVSGTQTAITGTGTSLNVNLTNSSVAVTGTFYQATQPVSVAPTTSGGVGLPFSASVTTVQAVKTSAGNVYGWSVLNNTAAIAYVQVFNKGTGSITLGSTAPDWVIPVPANGTTGAGNNFMIPLGVSHSTAISVACTTTRTGSTTAACDVLLFYE